MEAADDAIATVVQLVVWGKVSKNLNERSHTHSGTRFSSDCRRLLCSYSISACSKDASARWSRW